MISPMQLCLWIMNIRRRIYMWPILKILRKILIEIKIVIETGEKPALAIKRVAKKYNMEEGLIFDEYVKSKR